MKEPKEFSVRPNEVIALDKMRLDSAEFYLGEYLKYIMDPSGEFPFAKHVVVVPNAADRLVSIQGNQILWIARLLGVERVKAYLLLDDEEELPFLHAQTIDGVHLYPKDKTMDSMTINDIRGTGDDEDMCMRKNLDDPKRSGLTSALFQAHLNVGILLDRHEDLHILDLDFEKIWFEELCDETSEMLKQLLAD